MNIYFLVEGKRTEMKIYPKWLSFLIPELQRVKYPQDVIKNNYYLFNGNGYPSLLHNHLRNCIADINTLKLFDYFVICLDTDDQQINESQKNIIDFMTKGNIVINSSTKFEMIVQHKCIETWFLANSKIFKNNPNSSFLRDCITFYNVKHNDPELMEKPIDFEGSVSIFHLDYLKELLLERNIQYSKKNPQEVIEKYFLEKLIERNIKTKHIQSFGYFIEFCRRIRTQILQDTIYL